MQRLRDLINEFAGQMRVPTERPTSLYEAGNVGSAPGSRTARRDAPVDAWFESGAEPTAEERTTRRERPATARRPAVVQPSATSTLTASQIRTTLRNPESFRTAFLVKELLDKPVSRRPRRR